jgi:hypothetical protein
VADVFEGFGCVLAAYVEEDFFAAAVVRKVISEAVEKGGERKWKEKGRRREKWGFARICEIRYRKPVVFLESISQRRANPV